MNDVIQIIAGNIGVDSSTQEWNQHLFGSNGGKNCTVSFGYKDSQLNVDLPVERVADYDYIGINFEKDFPGHWIYTYYFSNLKNGGIEVRKHAMLETLPQHGPYPSALHTLRIEKDKNHQITLITITNKSFLNGLVSENNILSCTMSQRADRN